MSQGADEIRLKGDTFKILISSDNHLGYAEKDPIRGKDSFGTFEEILKTAVARDVDFILLGGDLFHDVRPTPYAYQKCTELLRKYCFGERSVEIEILSDPSLSFRTLNDPTVNYEDFNLNIAIPVFTIHGNHDDPVGQTQTSALDVLASAGLVNYFGRWTEMSYVEIRPILLQKGRTKLALYGLSHIRDERLGRLFRDKKVTFFKSPSDEWFNVLVLHQNRPERGNKNFIPESLLPDFFDLVIWGHEHDCRIEPDSYPNFFISQPGSTVATSLCQAESIPKKIGILNLHKTDFYMDFVPLTTVRPLVYEEIVLPNVDDPDYDFDNPTEQAERKVKEKVEEMLIKARENYPHNEMLPLIRLKVHYFEENQQFNTIRFGQMYLEDRVANHLDVVLLKHTKLRSDGTRVELSFNDDILEDVEEWAERVEDLVVRYLESNNTPLEILSVKGLTQSIQDFIDKNDEDAISDMIDAESELVYKKLLELDPPVEQIDDCIETVRVMRLEDPNLQVVLPDWRSKRQNNKNRDDDAIAIDSGDDVAGPSVSRSAASSRRTRGSGRTWVSSVTIDDESASNDDEPSVIRAEPPKRGRGSRGGRGSRSRGKAK